MNLKEAFYIVMKNDFLLKIFPKFSFGLIQSVIDTELFGRMYCFVCKVNKEEKTKREESKKYFENNLEDIRSVLEFLADEQSRVVYKGALTYRCTSDYKCIKNIAESYKKQYMDKIVLCDDAEMFVDAGAFFGEITQRFFDSTNKRNTSLVIEPEKYNFKICCKNLKRFGDRIIYENCGVGNSNITMYFKSGLYGSSRADKSGDNDIKITTIDDLCEKHNIVPTYIKIDIEGMDFEALKGSRNVITKYNPKLAVSIYHSDEDMVQIIQHVKNEYSFYDCYVRHYSKFFADTVLYCIPKGINEIK